MVLNDINKEVACDNVRRLENAIEKSLERFETSPNFHIVSYKNEWINHPDENFVESGVFKNLFLNYFGDIYLHHFLTDYKFDLTTIDKVKDFRNSCDALYSKLSYNEVECAYNQLLNLHIRLLNL